MNVLNRQLTPGMNYFEMLKCNFNISLPASTPTYVAEEIYRECLLEHQQGTTTENIQIAVKNSIDSMNGEFPWKNIEYDDIPEYSEIEDKKVYEDGDIIYNQETKMYSGYFDNRIVSYRSKLDKMKEVMERKYGITEFNLMKEEDEN